MYQLFFEDYRVVVIDRSPEDALKTARFYLPHPANQLDWDIIKLSPSGEITPRVVCHNL